jgi:glycosyltransferase involved in cell wall biosynthesis
MHRTAPREVPDVAEKPTLGIDVHSLADQRTGVAVYVTNLVRGLAAIGAAGAVRLYLQAPSPEAAGFSTRIIPRTPMWTTLRLSLHFFGHEAPRAMLFPAHVVPFYAPMPSVVTVHDLAFELFPKHFTRSDRIRLRTLTRRSVRKAARVIADSAATKRDLIELLHVPEERITVVHLGYDREHFRPSTAAEVEAVRRRYTLDRPYVIAVGTLQSRKNHEGLVRALARLIERGLDVDLVVPGAKGWLYENIFRTVRALGLEDRVHFLGFVPDADLPALYSGAEVAALVSLYEGFGLPVLEAMACGTPVVTSNVSSLPEVAGSAALLVNPQDDEAIADALARCITDQELRLELAGRARLHLEGFSWERTARETLAVLRGVEATIRG